MIRTVLQPAVNEANCLMFWPQWRIKVRSFFTSAFSLSRTALQ